jgi:hypothetical protein
LGKVSRTWQLILAPWSEAQRAALRRFGNDESSVLLFALRTDGGKLEVFVTCKAPRRAAWLAMPKRPVEARVLAAVAANDPPASANHLDDDEWHAAQDMWLVKWSGSVLPDGPQRRLKWNDRVKEHARLVAAAARAGSEQATPGAVRLRTIAWRASVAADDPPASADHLWTMTSGARHVAGQVREVERQRALRRPSSVRMLHARQCFDGGC